MKEGEKPGKFLLPHGIILLGWWLRIFMEDNPYGIQNQSSFRIMELSVKFHPLVTQSIGSLTYRQFDYASYMHYTHRLSRWLHKRLAHNYSQAGILHPYTIRMSTILRDSGTHHSLRASNNARQVEEALTELRERDILMSFTRDVLRGPRNSLADITYTLLPTMAFIEEVKKANRRV